jgi:undecaprenyl-diphosphatase
MHPPVRKLIVLAVLLAAAPFAAAQPREETGPPQQEAPAPETPAAQITLPQAAILGVVEGLTEYLPVSSTGHLILASHYMDLSTRSEETGPLGPRIIKNPAIDAFEVIIQVGAILAVLGLYRKQVGRMALGAAGRDPLGRHMLLCLIVAFLPAAVFGLLLHDVITRYLFSPYTVAGALIVGGVLMIVIEHIFWRRRREKRHITRLDRIRLWQAMVIGLAQCLAMWPGTSRSMVTILAGVIVGLNLVTAAEFSFLLALPTLGGATVYAMLRDYGPLMDACGPLALTVGIIVSGLAAALAVKAFVKWLTRHGMLPFGVYRIILGSLVLAYFAGWLG